MKAQISLRKAFADDSLLGRVMPGPSWKTWRVLFLAAMGESLSGEERAIFRDITGREQSPAEPVLEMAAIVGRRGGKSRAMATAAVYIAGLCDHSDCLVSGERGIILCIAPDQRQARILTLNRSLRGSENNDFDMGNYLNAADAVREEFGCAVIIVHHSGLIGGRPRGHSCLTGAADAQIFIQRKADRVVATVEYMKDGREGGRIESRVEQLQVGVDDEGEPITSLIVLESDGDAVTQAQAEPKGQAGTALNLLRRMLQTDGQSNEEAKALCVETVVSFPIWRGECLAAFNRNGKKESAEKAFRRALTLLDGLVVHDKRWVGIKADFGHADNSRTCPDRSHDVSDTHGHTL